LKEIDVEKVEEVKKRLEKIKAQMEEIKEQYRQDRNTLHKLEMGNDSPAAQDLLKKLNVLKDELSKINIEKKI